MKDRC